MVGCGVRFGVIGPGVGFGVWVGVGCRCRCWLLCCVCGTGSKIIRPGVVPGVGSFDLVWEREWDL